MKVLTTEKVRHLLFRAEAGEILPDGLARELRDQAVTCGWYRASGVLDNVELRAYDAALPGQGALRKIAGPVQVIALEGSVGLAAGDVSFGMRAILARETDRGMETIAGELAAARVVALEVIVSAFDDLAVAHAVDPAARVWLLGDSAGSAAAVAAAPSAPSAPKLSAPQPQRPPPPQTTPQSATPAWNDAVAASDAIVATPEKRPAAKPAPSGPGAAMPARPVRPELVQDDNTTFPEAGDMVEHFAFGRCEVIKSDGDRLHLKVGKDSRIREIALEMLRVTPIAAEGEQRLFRLDRRL